MWAPKSIFRGWSLFSRLRNVAGYSKFWCLTVWHDRLKITKPSKRQGRKLTSKARCKQETTHNCIVFRLQVAFVIITSEPKERSGGREHLSLPNGPLSTAPSLLAPRRHQLTTTTVATFSSHNCALHVSERWIVELVCLRLIVMGTWRVETPIIGESHL